jgi:predicted dehydrogenase
VGLVGCGRWGRHVLRDLLGLGCEVTVVAHSDATHARAAEGGAHRIVDALDDLPAVDGVVVVTPTETHADVVTALLQRGVPLFVEKPLTADAASAQRIAGEAADRAFVMHKWRYHQGVEELGRIARSGELGEVQGVACTRVGWGNPHKGVDAVWMLAPHDLSILIEVLGFIPQPRAAVYERVGDKPTGLTGLLGDTPWATVTVSASHPVRRREVRLVCSEGSAVLADSFAEEILIVRGDPHTDLQVEPERRPIGTELPLLRELRAFVEHLTGGPPPRSSAAEGAAEVTVLAELVRLADAVPSTA